MRIWNVSPMYYKNSNKIKYIVLPYDLKIIITAYIKNDTIKNLFIFLFNCRFTEKSARKYANKKQEKYNKKKVI